MTPILESELRTHESALFRALVVESHRVIEGEPQEHWSPLAVWLIFGLVVFAVACVVAFVATLPASEFPRL